jgi:hypothetical protein
MQAFVFLARYETLRMEHATAPSLALPGPPETDVPFYPWPLPRHLLQREVLYNAARAAHQASLNHIAAHLYKACLEVEAPDESEGAVPSSSDAAGVLGTTEPLSAASAAAATAPSPSPSHALAVAWNALDVRREAAYNLSLLYAATGNVARAAAVRVRYLSID